MRFIKYLLLGALSCLTSEAKELQSLTWEEMSPTAKDKDWLELKTREWLRGEFISLYNDKVVFKSDKLKKLTFKLKDVRQLIVHNNQNVNISNEANVVGKIKLNKNDAIITTADGVDIKVKRKQLVAIALSSDNELDLWKMSAKLGLTLTSGNVDKTDYSGRVDLVRRGVDTRFNISYTGNYSSANNIQTTNNTYINSNLDVFQTKRFFYQPFVGSFNSDSFQNLRYRYTLGVGIGYNFIDEDDMQLSISGGPQYQAVEYMSVQKDSQKRQSSPLLAVSTLYNYDITADITFTWKYDLKYMNQEAGLYTHYMLTSLSYDLTSKVDINLDFQWNRTQHPQNYENGTIPKKDDYISSVKLGYDY